MLNSASHQMVTARFINHISPEYLVIIGLWLWNEEHIAVCVSCLYGKVITNSLETSWNVVDVILEDGDV